MGFTYTDTLLTNADKMRFYLGELYRDFEGW